MFEWQIVGIFFAEPPKITDQPADIIDISKQQNANFSIIVTGHNLNFVWQKRKLDSADFTDISKSGRRVHCKVEDGRSCTRTVLQLYNYIPHKSAIAHLMFNMFNTQYS